MPLIQNVTFQQVIHDLKANGSPGAEIITTDFIVLAGGNVGLPAGGSVITNPQRVKLYDEYDYYLYEIRLSCNALPGLAAIGATPYIPVQELEHVTLQLQMDGRSRPLFRQPMPFSQLIAPNGNSVPFRLDQWVALGGNETLVGTVALAATWNPAPVAAQLDFTVSALCTLVRHDAIRPARR